MSLTELASSEPTSSHLTVVAWTDPVVDALGHDPRSRYVETFWLGILGPSTTWLVRRLADGLDRHPEGYRLPLAETARSLGLGDKGGKHSPFLRSLRRCCQFGVAQDRGDCLAVRRRLPPLTRGQVERLSPELAAEHHHWTERELAEPPGVAHRRRARRLAIGLAELGDDTDAIERRLHTWHIHPAMAHEAAHWAHQELRARHAGDDAGGDPEAAATGGDAA